MTSKAFDDLNEQMLPRLLSANPDCATVFGKHEPYDTQLPDGGSRRLKDNLELLREWSKAANEISAEGTLSRDQEVSADVLRFTLDMYRFAVEGYPIWRMRPEALENPGTAMLMAVVREYAPLEKRVEWMTSRIGELPRYLEQFRGRFAGARTVRLWTRTALGACVAFPSFLDVAQSLAASSSADMKVRAEMAGNVALAKEELKIHGAWLEKMLDSSTDEFAMGRERYEKLMRIRGIPFSSQGLVILASEHLMDFTRQRAAVASRISNGGTLDEARRIVESERPTSTDEGVERTKEVVERAREFVIGRDIATVPAGSMVHVMRAPDFLGDSVGTASTYLPAVFERSQDSIFLIAPVKDPKQLGSIWNYPAIDSTGVHEAFPGHHHQGVMANTRPWMHQLPHIIYSPEALSPPYESQEGWATYCESMMHEKGFLGSDRHLLGLLDYAVGNACRMLAEVKLACGNASVDEMVDMTVRETGCLRVSAEADVKGFTHMPGYGMCYLAGRHLVAALKADLRKALAGGFSEKRFHDLMAQNSNLPFFLLEREVRSGMGLPTA